MRYPGHGDQQCSTFIYSDLQLLLTVQSPVLSLLFMAGLGSSPLISMLDNQRLTGYTNYITFNHVYTVLSVLTRCKHCVCIDSIDSV